MSASTCPDLEVLFVGLEEHAPWAREHLDACEICTAVFEEHRLIEQQLSRVMDPPPPSDFVQQVMARVAVAPVPRRREFLVGAGILLTALVASLSLLVSQTPSLDRLGLKAVSRAMDGSRWMEGLAGGLRVMWSLAGPQLLFGLGLLFLFALYGLRRLAGSPSGLEA